MTTILLVWYACALVALACMGLTQNDITLQNCVIAALFAPIILILGVFALMEKADSIILWRRK
jgi:hypothetical protein